MNMTEMMKGLAPALQASGTVMGVMSNFQAMQASRLMAQRRQQAAEFAAQQLEQNAGQSVAAGIAAAEEQRREGTVVGSNILASAAASGGGASDPSVMTAIARNAGLTSYNSDLALYQGAAEARQQKMQADAARYGGAMSAADGSAASRAQMMKGFSTALTGGASLMSKYFPGGVSLKPAGWDTSFDNPSDYG